LLLGDEGGGCLSALVAPPRHDLLLLLLLDAWERLPAVTGALRGGRRGDRAIVVVASY
jgi:hypothetical protein